MKGLKVERAQPSNAIDIYALLKLAAEDGAFHEQTPSSKQLQQYYFQKLIPFEVMTPSHFWYLAKRGRGFLGLLHAFIVPGRWDGEINTIYVDLVYVVEHRRNRGIAKELLKKLKEDAEDIGIKKFEFLAVDKVQEKWVKDWKATKISNYMRVEL